MSAGLLANTQARLLKDNFRKILKLFHIKHLTNTYIRVIILNVRREHIERQRFNENAYKRWLGTGKH